MTISSETSKSGPYFGNGSTKVFDYQFRIVDETHLTVIKRDTSGVESTLILNTDYTVADVGQASGGQITLDVAPAVGETTTILRNVPFTQETDLENQGAYYAETVEAAFDLMAMRDQQLQEQINRSVKIPASADSADLDTLIGDIVRIGGSADNIDTVADNIGSVNTVADKIADVSTVAVNVADVNAVAAINAKVSTVADISDDVTTVADDRADIATVAGVAAAVSIVAGVSADVATVAANDEDISTVAGVSADVSAVAAVAEDVSTVAASIAAIGTVSANISAVQSTATNMAAIQAAPQAADDAETARDFAHDWSSAPEDQPVDDGVSSGYSAYHWSKKAEAAAGGGVSSVGLSAPSGFSVSGSPVTGSGTLTFTYDSGYQGYTTAEANKLAGIETGAQVNPSFGTTAGTAAAGDDSRIVGALQGANVATFAQFNAATADKVLEADSVWANLATLTDGTDIAVDFNNGYDFGGASNAALALGGNRTLSAPTNARNGKKGILWFTATGATRTLTLNGSWNIATGVEAGPYSITTSQTLGLAYVCRGTTVIVTAIVRLG